MTLTAVAQASDEDLKELGLSKKGDRLALINLCKTQLHTGDQQAHEKKTSLLSKILMENKSKRRG